jgi:hypothetical protein
MYAATAMQTEPFEKYFTVNRKLVNGEAAKRNADRNFKLKNGRLNLEMRKAFMHADIGIAWKALRLYGGPIPVSIKNKLVISVDKAIEEYEQTTQLADALNSSFIDSLEYLTLLIHSLHCGPLSTTTTGHLQNLAKKAFEKIEETKFEAKQHIAPSEISSDETLRSSHADSLEY